MKQEKKATGLADVQLDDAGRFEKIIKKIRLDVLEMRKEKEKEL